MKRFILSLVVFACCTLAVSAVPWGRSQMLAGSQVILSNNSTTYFNSTNTLFIGKLGFPTYPLSYPLAYFSLTSTSQAPTVVSGTIYYTNYALYSSLYPTNGGIINDSNVVFGMAWKPAIANADANGDVAPESIGIVVHGLDANASNTVTFTFVPADVNPTTGAIDNIYTNATATFAPGVAILGTSGTTTLQPATVITNIPTSQVQGVNAWILWKATVTSVSSSTGVSLDSITLRQPTP